MMCRVRLLLLLGPLSVLLALTGTAGVPPAAVAALDRGATGVDPVRLSARVGAVQALEQDAVAVVNRARARAGCRALKVSAPLRVSARRHSARMARRDRLTHRLPGEAVLARRVVRAGYTRPRMLGEVIAYGPRTGRTAVRLGLRSPLHRRILLDCRLRHLGAGVVRTDTQVWWTIDLGKR
ncbi:Cysteine-rich secretory protein family protein [Nocardioides sp. J9]|nr:Cysteine-rich secretory protein family protein [Nocardioides sp. J9]